MLENLDASLKILENWYSSHCDGDWEHGFGIQIETLDNPGWSVKIDTKGTNIEYLNIEEIENFVSNDDWIIVRKENKKLVGHCGAKQLSALLRLLAGYIKIT